MMLRDELLRVERDRWNEFDRLVQAVPPDRLDEPTLNPDGWSVKDLLWHMGSWDAEIADQLERIRAGTYASEYQHMDDHLPELRFVDGPADR
jgi:Mycothiol maleylpyruvate isomerase N-terminal domain